MIFAIGIPKGSSVNIDNGKIIIVYDENITRADLWNLFISLWVVKGDSIKEFWDNSPEDSGALIVSKKNKVSFERHKK